MRHGEAAQLKFTEKLRHYSRHHDFPSRVCYPLAFERSGYLHPVFDDFIDLFARCSSVQPQPHTALQLKFAVAFAITFTTAELLRSASHRLLPRSLLPFVAPKPLTIPLCWAPSLPLSSSRRTSQKRSATASSPPVPRTLDGTLPPPMPLASGGPYSTENFLSGACRLARVKISHWP